MASLKEMKEELAGLFTKAWADPEPTRTNYQVYGGFAPTAPDVVDDDVSPRIARGERVRQELALAKVQQQRREEHVRGQLQGVALGHDYRSPDYLKLMGIERDERRGY